jgi:hypothetical protein
MKKILFAATLILGTMSAFAQAKPTKKVTDNTPVVAVNFDFTADEANVTEATAAQAAVHRTDLMATRYRFTPEQRAAALQLNTAYLTKCPFVTPTERTTMREQILEQIASHLKTAQRRLIIADYELWRKTH